MIPKDAKDLHQKYRLMSGSGLKLIQDVTVERRCPGFIVRRDGEGERDTIDHVIDNLGKGE